MATKAIKPVQFEFVFEAGPGHESPQLCRAHVSNILEYHVVGNGADDGIGLLVGKPESAEEALRHLRADPIMAVEADASCLIDHSGGGFAYVMKQNGPDQCKGGFRCQQAEHQAGVHKHIAFGMEFRRLVAAFERGDFRENSGEQSGLIQQIECGESGGSNKHAGKFVPDAFGAYIIDERREFAESLPGCGLDLIVKPGGKPDCSKQAQFVLLKAISRSTNGANNALLQVAHSTNVIPHDTCHGIVEKAVDCKIPAFGILLLGNITHGIRTTTVTVIAVRAKGGDLEGEAVFDNDNDPEVGADRDIMREDGPHLIRFRICCDINVRSHGSQKGISNDATRVEGSKAMIHKFANHRQGIVRLWTFGWVKCPG